MNKLVDTPQRYGRVSRSFHWLMAVLFGWQFAGALLFVSIGDTTVTRFVGGSHLTLGFTLFILVLLRGAWAMANLRRRPRHPGKHGLAVVAGHALIYSVMILQPSIALLRQYGSGKPFTPYGIPVMSARDYKIEWMMVPADVAHYWLGFAFLVIIFGHMIMAVLHKRLWNENALARMT